MKLTKDSIDGMGSCFHTALRKLCDNNETSIAYNIIAGMSSDDWTDYIGIIQHFIKDLDFKDKDEFETKIKNISINIKHLLFLAQDDFDRKNKESSSLLMALQCTFKLFSDNDWHNYCEYIELK